MEHPGQERGPAMTDLFQVDSYTDGGGGSTAERWAVCRMTSWLEKRRSKGMNEETSDAW